MLEFLTNRCVLAIHCYGRDRHRIWWLVQTQRVAYLSVGQKSEMELTELNPDVGKDLFWFWGVFFWWGEEAPGKICFHAPFPASGGCLYFLAHGPFLHLETQQCNIFSSF